MIGEIGESILHAVVAASIIETLIRAWHLDCASARLRLRVACIAVMSVWSPLLDVVAPWRRDDVFLACCTVYSGARWDGLSVMSVGVARLATVACAALGLALFLADFIPSLAELPRRARSRRPSPPDGGDDLVAETRNVAAAMGMTCPRVSVADARQPVLLCHGLFSPRIVMSRQALDRLDPAERRAALTHELLHARHRDPLTGWALMIWRLVFWFNPVVQILARAVVVDLEQRADEQAAAITTDPAAMSSALLKLFRAATGVSDGAGPALWEPVFLQRLRRLQIRHIEGRCRALLKTRAAVSAPGVAQAVVAALAVAALLVVVV